MDKKRHVAQEAVKYVKEGDVVGLGSGTTASEFIKILGESNLKTKVVGVATSIGSERLARNSGIKVVDIDSVQWIDICVDGADEVDEALDILKGGGGQLTREKKVRNKSKKYLIIVTDDKLVTKIPEKRGIAVEILQFGYRTTIDDLESLGMKCEFRENFVTDNGNFICDCRPLISIPLDSLGAKIKAITGVVEHGLFIGQEKTILISDGKTVRKL